MHEVKIVLNILLSVHNMNVMIVYNIMITVQTILYSIKRIKNYRNT